MEGEMFKRTHTSLLFIMLAAVTLLCATTRAEASCSTAELQASTCFSAGGFDIRIVPGPNGEFPVNSLPGFCNAAATCFSYSVTQNTTKNIAQVDVLIPVCTSNNGIDNTITPLTGYPSGWHVSLPGDGGQNTSWAYGVFQDYVLEYSFNTTSSFWLSTTQAVAGKTSMAFKVGSTLYAGAIQGPACYQPKIATTTTQRIQLNPNNPDAFIVVTLRTDGSVVSVVDNTGTPLSWHDLSEFSINGEPVTYLPDGTVMKTGANSCYSYVYLGRACTKCF
jgi:hypothetical protein